MQLKTLQKIIGFTISEKAIPHIDVDIFKVGLTLKSFQYGGFFVYLWGIGKIEKTTFYSLGFPPGKSLSDRNVTINLQSNQIIIENDWLGSIPVFYNSPDKIISTLPNKCLINKTFSSAGLSNYFEFGYSVFGQTAFESVKFMTAFSKITIGTNSFVFEEKEDIYSQKLAQVKNVVTDFISVVDAHKLYIQEIENEYNIPKIIPTSGGYDSRLLNIWTQNKKEVFSFTYGISKKQNESKEVVYAKKLSKLLGTSWKQLQLGNFMQFIPETFRLFGFSIGLFTMYHVDFYKKIQQNVPQKSMLWYSGIFGDVWSGGVVPTNPKIPEQLNLLGYRHGLHLSKKFLPQFQNAIKNDFFDKNKPYFNNEATLLLNIVRIKIMLISYLTTLPEYFGYPVVTPFLNFNLVKMQLSLSSNLRLNRKWQYEYFKQENVNIESLNLKYNRRNTVNFEAAKQHSWQNINTKFFTDKILIQEINKINKQLTNIPKWMSLKNSLLTTMYIKELLKNAGIKDTLLELLTEYQVIKPLEMAFYNKKDNDA